MQVKSGNAICQVCEGRCKRVGCMTIKGETTKVERNDIEWKLLKE